MGPSSWPRTGLNPNLGFCQIDGFRRRGLNPSRPAGHRKLRPRLFFARPRKAAASTFPPSGAALQRGDNCQIREEAGRPAGETESKTARLAS